MKAKSKPKTIAKRMTPVEVTVSIDANGAANVCPDPVVVQGKKNKAQKVRWVLDQQSRKTWRLRGLGWCGDEPPKGEFKDWTRRGAAISAMDRNSVEGEWRYALFYQERKKPRNAPPKVLDPTIRNEPR